jgi:DNA-binding response OmpR family regulator
LEQNGYELLTATNGADGLRLFMSRPVDAIVLDYQLGLLDGGVVATEIKKVKPQVPIVMLAEDVELPADALKSVDALVAKSDGPHFLLATVHFVLNVKPAQRREGKLKVPNTATSAARGSRQGRNVGMPTLLDWREGRTLFAGSLDIRNGTGATSVGNSLVKFCEQA